MLAQRALLGCGDGQKSQGGGLVHAGARERLRESVVRARERFPRRLGVQSGVFAPCFAHSFSGRRRIALHPRVVARRQGVSAPFLGAVAMRLGRLAIEQAGAFRA